VPLDVSDYEFQTKVVTLMLASRTFLTSYRDALKPELFEYEEHQTLVRQVLGYYDKYHEPPTLDNLRYQLENYEKTKPIATKTWAKYLEGIQELLHDSSLAFVHDEMEKFLRFRVYVGAMGAMTAALKKYDFNGAAKAFMGALRYEIKPTDGIEFTDSVYDRLTKVINRDTIPTGIRALDDAMGGGTAKGEMTVVLAPPGRGKTTLLVNLGAAGVENGRTVYHFFGEQNENAVWYRYARRFLHLDYATLRAKPKRHSYLLEQLFEQTGTRLRIASCLGKEVSALRGYIYRHGAPDALIVDYADKMLPSARYSEIRFELSRIYDDLYQMCAEFNIALWTASQSNRDSLGKEVVTIGDFAEDFNKAAIVDNVLALCQTKKEETTDDMRIFTAKVREDKGHEEIHCKIYRSQMRVVSVDDVWRRRLKPAEEKDDDED